MVALAQLDPVIPALQRQLHFDLPLQPKPSKMRSTIVVISADLVEAAAKHWPEAGALSAFVERRIREEMAVEARTFNGVTLTKKAARALKEFAQLCNTPAELVLAFIGGYQIENFMREPDEEGWHVFYARKLRDFRIQRERTLREQAKEGCRL